MKLINAQTALLNVRNSAHDFSLKLSLCSLIPRLSPLKRGTFYHVHDVKSRHDLMLR